MGNIEIDIAIGGLAIILGIIFIVFLVRKFVEESNNPYQFTQYFDRSIMRISVFEVEGTEPSSFENPRVSKVIFTQRGKGLFGSEGFYYNGMVYSIPYELINLSRTMQPSLMVIRVGKYGIMPLSVLLVPSEACEKHSDVKVRGTKPYFPIKYPQRISAEIEEEKLKYENLPMTSFNLVMLKPSTEMLNYMTDSNITSFFYRQRSIIRKVESNLEQLVKFVAAFGVVVIGAIVIISLAIISASDIVVKAVEVSG